MRDNVSMIHSDHVGDGLILAYVDQELAPELADAVAQHINRCTRCTRSLHRLTALDAVLCRALENIPAAQIDVNTARAAVRNRSAAPGAVRRRGAGWSIPRAAVIVLVLAVGGSAAVVPNSPVWQWVQAQFATSNGGGRRSLSAESVRSPERARGVEITPTGDSVWVEVHDARPSALLRVRQTETDDVGVFMEGANDQLAFRTVPGKVTVSGSGPATITVALPRSISRALVKVNGWAYATKEEGAIAPRVKPTFRSDTLLVFRIRR